MKISKRQLKRIIKEEKRKLVREMNPDGTISADEEEETDDLMMHLEVEIDNLIQYVKDEAERIGGSFRAPAIKRDAFYTMLEKIHQARS